jgi:hypothetical protein
VTVSESLSQESLGLNLDWLRNGGGGRFGPGLAAGRAVLGTGYANYGGNNLVAGYNVTEGEAPIEQEKPDDGYNGRNGSLADNKVVRRWRRTAHHVQAVKEEFRELRDGRRLVRPAAILDMGLGHVNDAKKRQTSGLLGLIDRGVRVSIDMSKVVGLIVG